MKKFDKNESESIAFYGKKVLVLLAFICAITGLAQKRTLKTESDGYKWYATSSNERYFQEGAEDLSGRTIIPPIYHFVAYDVDAEAFRVTSQDGDGYIDKKGKILVPAKYKLTWYKNGSFFVKLGNGNVVKLENVERGNTVNSSSSGRKDSKVEVRTIKCKMCSGDGKCTLCDGAGNIMGPYSYLTHTPTIMQCYKCMGLKKCTLCHGTGTIETFFCDGVEISLDEINRVIDAQTSGGTGRSSSKYSTGNHSGNNDKITCPDCKGTGKHTFCNGKGVYKNSYDYNWYDCDMCNKTGICPTCHGKTYIWAD